MLASWGDMLTATTNRQACATLKSLEYCTGGEKFGPENFTLADIFTLLQPYKSSLEELHIDLSLYWDFDREPETLPSLVDFTVLKTLNTNMATWGDLLFLSGYVDDDDHLEMDSNGDIENASEMLCGRLPPNLATLTLHGPLPHRHRLYNIRQLQHLIAKRHEFLPSLKSVTYVENEYRNATELHPIFRSLTALENADNDGFQFLINVRARTENRTGAYFAISEDQSVHAVERKQIRARVCTTSTSTRTP